MRIDPPLSNTLAALADRLSVARHDWWIISSVAVALHGGDPGRIGDVDVLIDRRDVETVFTGLGLPIQPGESSALFRSRCFGVWRGAELPVELFADFDLFRGGAWEPVVPTTRESVTVGSVTLYVPAKAELTAMLHRFGRPKDLARAATLT